MISRLVSFVLIFTALLAGVLGTGPMGAPRALAGPAATAQPSITRGLRLLMVETPGCIYCRQWRAEILPGYDAHPQGRAAPLARIDIDGPWPDGLALARRPVVTPTFILVDGGREIARLEGYPGRDAFWPLIADMQARGVPW